MGAVYRAIDTELGRTVAVKCLLQIDELGARERALKEARVLAALEHPNILRVYDIIDESSQIWIVSEWVEGQSLGQTRMRHAPTLVAAIMSQVYDALAAAHAAGVFHRDIKPENLMVSPNGRVTLIDFGVAYTQSWSSGRTMAGSLRYAAPRILEGAPPDAQTDLFSAGLVQLELLTGSPILPDLAPLPLYRHLTKHLKERVEQACDGLWPPLARLSQRILLDSASKMEAIDAATAAATALANLRQITQLTPTQYVAIHFETLGWADKTAADVLEAMTQEHLALAQLSARQKQSWLSFADITAAERSGKRKAESPTVIGGKQKSSSKIHPLALSALIVSIAATLAIWFFKPAPSTSQAPVPIAAGPAPAGKSATGGEALLTPDSKAEESLATTPNLPKDSESNTIAATKIIKTEDSSGLQSETTKVVAKTSPVPVELVANAWANVFIDGQEIARLPSAKPIMLVPGERRIRLESPLVETMEVTILVKATGTNRFNFKLQPRATERVLTLSKPASLTVNGVDYGVVSQKKLRLPFGSHDVRIRRKDEPGRDGKIVIGPETPTEIRID